MASNRSDLLTKTHKVLKKHFKPASANLRLPLLEQLVYACCLEDASSELADKAFAALEEQFYDWNEVRVSTVTELSEAVGMLSAPREAATRVKRTLQSVFEANYSFDLEHFKKDNIGVAVKKLNRYKGISPFGISYVTQTALGGHSIPLGAGALEVLFVVGVINDKEKQTGTVPGLERAISKNKGLEFGSLLNQLGADFHRSPHGSAVRKIILQITPEARGRLPKRRTKKDIEAEAKAKAKQAAEAKRAAQAKADRAKKKTGAKKTATARPKAPGKKTVTVKRKKKIAEKPAATRKKVAKKKVAKKKVPKKKLAKKKVAKRVTRRNPR